MLPDRQRLLLSLVDALGGYAQGTDFQKLLFLYTKEWEIDPSYEFVPYHFGGFSFTSYADKRKLIERGFLVDSEETWELSQEGGTEAQKDHALKSRIGRFIEAHSNLRGDSLVAEVYRRHPYYATRSRISERVLTSAEDRAAIAAAKPTPKGPGLVTIGYEGRGLDEYLNVLIQNSVTILCDVRRNPLSRKYGFSKKTLSSACEGVGIRYEHIPELGIASEERKGLKTQADYDALFETYKRETLPQQKPALQLIRSWIEKEKYRVALTCFEAQPCQCHRHCVAEALQVTGGPRCVAVHL